MLKIFKNNTIFFLSYILFLIVGAFVLLYFNKAEIHIAINKLHNNFSDKFFFFITYLGDGWFAVFITIVLIFNKFRNAILVAGSGIISAIIVQILKNIFFPNVLRPAKYFENIYNLYIIEGFDLHSLHSFPSGHTATAFCVFLSLSLILKNKEMLKLFFFILAIAVGYSRIYLSQHFFIDVYFGSIIGVVVALISYYYIQKSKAHWLDKSVLTKNKSTGQSLP